MFGEIVGVYSNLKGAIHFTNALQVRQNVHDINRISVIIGCDRPLVVFVNTQNVTQIYSSECTSENSRH